MLQILDTAWKDHLLAMDHLRSSVGLRGYAQVDPKVEYKREGMRTFELMWSSVGERVTDLVFRMEQLDEDSSARTWAESEAIHEEAQSASRDRRAAAGRHRRHARRTRKLEPIRNRGERVGRNDPCPCGSGKKFKNCCMRQERQRTLSAIAFDEASPRGERHGERNGDARSVGLSRGAKAAVVIRRQ